MARVKRMEQVSQARDKVLDALVDGTEVPLPESIVAAEVESTTHDAIHGFEHDEEKFAAQLESDGSSREQFDAETREEAEKSVRTRLVLDALADAEQVSVNDQELTERIVYQAQQYRMPPEEFVRRIQEAGQLGAIYADVRRTKALIAAVRAATVTDASGATIDLSDLLGDEDDGIEVTEVPGEVVETEDAAEADAAEADAAEVEAPEADAAESTEDKASGSS
jgi:trigger factor